MRVLFITRIHPDRRSSRLGRRLHERLCELSELGHDVLVFTQWRGEQVEFQLPKRIEVRFPFRSFRAWEWPMAAALAVNWQPEIVHIVDPGLGFAEKVFSAEVSTLPLLDGLRISTRNRLRPRAVVSHFSQPDEHARTVNFWMKLGVAATESEWLSLNSESPSFQRPLSEIDVEETESLDTSRAPRRFVLAGSVHDRTDFLNALKSAIDFLQAMPEIELTVFCDRTLLNIKDRRRLQEWERRAADFDSGNSAAAFRLRLETPSDALEVLQTGHFDGAIVAGLSPSSLKAWSELLPMPLVGSESQKQELLKDPRTLGLVSDVAWMPQSLACLSKDLPRNEIWSILVAGALEAKRDIAVNRISRLYSQILAHPTSPSYS